MQDQTETALLRCNAIIAELRLNAEQAEHYRQAYMRATEEAQTDQPKEPPQ